MVGTQVPENILNVEIVGIVGVSVAVLATVIFGNVAAINKLKAAGKSISAMHWFPTLFSLFLTVESLTCSLTGVYELWLDQLYAPSAPAIVIPIFVMLGYSYTSKSLREMLEVTPTWWLFIPHLTRFSGLLILMLVWEGALAPHVGLPIGWGDILCAVLAGPAAWWVWSRSNGWRNVLIGFGVLGVFDYILSLQLTVWTLPLPIRLIHTELDSTVLAFWPVGVAPTLYVPLLYLTLFSMFIRAKQLKSSG